MAGQVGQVFDFLLKVPMRNFIGRFCENQELPPYLHCREEDTPLRQSRTPKKIMKYSEEKPLERTLSMFNGRAVCVRCTARSKRTGDQCKAPAIAGKTKCKTHGGLSTGARTSEGKARAAAAKTKHGQDTNAARAARHAAQERLQDLETIGRELGFITGPRSPGRPLKRSD